MKDESGRKVLGKYEVVEHTLRTGRYWTVRKDGREIPGKFNSIKTATDAIENHQVKSQEHRTRVVKEVLTKA